MSIPVARTRLQNIGLILGPVLAMLILLFFDPDPDRPQVGRMASAVALMATWWITEAVPLAATSLLPMVLFPLMGISQGTETAKAYMNSVIFLFLGGFLIALAMERWNLHRRIALNIIYYIGRKPDGIILGFMVASAFLSMWISNTATAVMMLPIGLAIIGKMEETFGKERSHMLAVTLMIGIAYGCSIGGVATLVGTPTNLAFARIFEETFPKAEPISFGQWFIVGLPISIVVLLTTWLLLTKVLCRLDPEMALDREVIHTELKSLGRVGYEEKVVMIAGTTTALLWIFRKDLVLGDFTLPGWSRLWEPFSLVDDSTIAVGMALLLFIWPAGREAPAKAILEGRAFRDLPWSAVLLFGGGFAMAAGFGASGLTGYLAEQFGKMGDVPDWVILVIACLGVAFLTELVSNIATVQIMLPIFVSLAIARGIHPLTLMVPATMVASMAFMMPVATPPNAVIFGSERLRIIEMVRAGFFVKIAAVVITMVLSSLLLPLVFGFDPNVMPDWAK